MKTCDFLIIGGGVVGLSVARALLQRFDKRRIVVLEAEAQLSAHASGRNSGVLHAGFYYTSDSLKAKLCAAGNRAWRAYCGEHGLVVRESGKVVIARTDAEAKELDVLHQRALSYGIPIERVEPERLRQLEPLARSERPALFSPTTASVDPRAVMQCLANDLRGAGVTIEMGNRAVAVQDGLVRTASDGYDAGCVINAAGLGADRVAGWYGCGRDYALVPFRGVYIEAVGDVRLQRHVYPVPNPETPFLGVHFTVRADGQVKIGPSASVALWRHQYGGPAGFSLSEACEIGAVLPRMIAAGGAGMRKLVVEETIKLNPARMRHLASRLVTGVDMSVFRRRGAVGIRAQLVRRDTGALVSDFVIEDGERSVHVLNAISPGFTCAIPFAELIVDRVAARAR